MQHRTLKPIMIIFWCVLLLVTISNASSVAVLDDGEAAQEPDGLKSVNATAECSSKGLHPCHCVYKQQISLQPAQTFLCVGPVCEIAYEKPEKKNSSSSTCTESDGCSGISSNPTWLDSMLDQLYSPPKPKRVCCCTPAPTGGRMEASCNPYPLQMAVFKHHPSCQNTTVASAAAAIKAAAVGLTAYSGPSDDSLPVPAAAPAPAPVPVLADSSPAGSYNVLMWGLFAVPIVIVGILLCGCCRSWCLTERQRQQRLRTLEALQRRLNSLLPGYAPAHSRVSGQSPTQDIEQAGASNTGTGTGGQPGSIVFDRQRRDILHEDGFLMEMQRATGAGRGEDRRPGRGGPAGRQSRGGGVQRGVTPTRDVFTSWENLLTVLAVLESVQSLPDPIQMRHRILPGLSPSLISELPLVTAEDHKSEKEGQEHKEAEDTCTICLETFESGQQLRIVPGCLHAFHQACIDDWLSHSATCPNCRHIAVPEYLLPILEEAQHHNQNVSS